MRIDRARKGSAFVSEELAFEKACGIAAQFTFTNFGFDGG